MTKKKTNVKKWVVYCLQSKNPRKKNYTYVGKTCDFKRRHRQHNKEIVGGARYTKMHGPWKTLFKIKGLKTNRQALQLEWALKHRRKGKSGPTGRCQTLEYLLTLDRWTKKSPLVKSFKDLRIKFYGTKTLYLNLSKKKVPNPKIQICPIKKK